MTADTIGGVWTYALELTRELGKSGVEVSLATMGSPLDARQRSQAESLGNLMLHESGFKLEWMQDPWEDIEEAGRWLMDLERMEAPDIIHLNGYVHASLPWKAPVLVVGHSCVYSWHEAVMGAVPSESWERYRREVTRGLRSAGLVATPTGAMLDMLMHHYGEFQAAPPVYNGRIADEFQPREKEPIIMAAGRVWDEAKNLRALERLTGNGMWPVVIAGECAHPDGGEVCLEGVRCLGKLSSRKLADWLGKASIFTLPARYEPFGYCALEAGLAGCALILGDIPSFREIWGKAALYVPPDNPDQLEATVRRLIEHDSLRILLGKRARAKALEFSPERMGNDYLRLYEMLIGNSGSGKDFISSPYTEEPYVLRR